MTQALEGIRILDFSRIWAGPHATRLLADMGAEVTKVESAGAWDAHRMIVGSGIMPDGDRGPDPWNRSGWFNILHQSKYGITPDIRHAESKAVLEELVSISDVVIENFRAGTLPVEASITRPPAVCVLTSSSSRCPHSGTRGRGGTSSSTESVRSSWAAYPP